MLIIVFFSALDPTIRSDSGVLLLRSFTGRVVASLGRDVVGGCICRGCFSGFLAFSRHIGQNARGKQVGFGQSLNTRAIAVRGISGKECETSPLDGEDIDKDKDKTVKQ